MTEHYDDDALAALLDGEPECDRSHLSECLDCREAFEKLRKFTQVLCNPAVWPLEDQARRSKENREEAQAILNELQHEAVENWITKLEGIRRLPSAALASALASAARIHYDNTPANAMPILDVAAFVASRITDHAERAIWIAEVAKERGNSLRLSGRLPEALAELRSAEDLLRAIPGTDYEVAFVLWGRGTVLFAMQRLAEALTTIREAKKILVQYEADDRVNHVSIVEGGILCEQGDIETAHALFASLVSSFEDDEDQEGVARALTGLATCKVRRSEFPAAMALAERTRKIFSQLGMYSEIPRVRWNMGRVLMQTERVEEALLELERAATDFDARLMKTDAGRVRLDILENLIVRKRWAEARVLARTLSRLFSEAEAGDDAAAAFSQLRKALQGMTATADDVAPLRERLMKAS